MAGFHEPARFGAHGVDVAVVIREVAILAQCVAQQQLASEGQIAGTVECSEAGNALVDRCEPFSLASAKELTLFFCLKESQICA